MALQPLWRNDAVNTGPTKTNNVILKDSVGSTIETKSVVFSAVNNTWRAANIIFDNIAAGTIIGSYTVEKQTGPSNYIENQAISGTEAERTIGAAGGQVDLTIEVAIT
jgi:hypothetical protein